MRFVWADAPLMRKSLLVQIGAEWMTYFMNKGLNVCIDGFSRVAVSGCVVSSPLSSPLLSSLLSSPRSDRKRVVYGKRGYIGGRGIN